MLGVHVTEASPGHAVATLEVGPRTKRRAGRRAAAGRVMARAPRRGTRAFLRQVADELPSHLPPKLRAFQAEQWGRFYKVWYAERKIHFEVQFVSGGRLQIGLHLEADA